MATETATGPVRARANLMFELPGYGYVDFTQEQFDKAYAKTYEELAAEVAERAGEPGTRWYSYWRPRYTKLELAMVVADMDV